MAVSGEAQREVARGDPLEVTIDGEQGAQEAPARSTALALFLVVEPRVPFQLSEKVEDAPLLSARDELGERCVDGLALRPLPGEPYGLVQQRIVEIELDRRLASPGSS